MQNNQRPHYKKIAEVLNWLLDEIEREERQGRAGSHLATAHGQERPLAS